MLGGFKILCRASSRFSFSTWWILDKDDLVGAFKTSSKVCAELVRVSLLVVLVVT